MFQFIKDYGAFIAAIIAPLAAVLITVWYQNRQARRTAKMNLFLDLVSLRDYIPLPWQYTIALNRIDVVFHDQPTICHLWHEYYELTDAEQIGDRATRVREKKVALISAMAKHLGYKNIDQIFLQRYYQTQGQVNDYLSNADIQKELLRVLKSTETLFLLGKYADDPYSKDMAEGKITRQKLSEQDNEKPV